MLVVMVFLQFLRGNFGLIGIGRFIQKSIVVGDLLEIINHLKGFDVTIVENKGI